MEIEQEGYRIVTLRKTIAEITAITDLANPTGIKSIKFLNAKKGLRNIKSTNWKKKFNTHDFDGMTRTGTSLQKKVLDLFVWSTLMVKPLLVITITDGDVRSPRLVLKAFMGCLLYQRWRANAAGCWKMFYEIALRN